jgi:hypothetical protein
MSKLNVEKSHLTQAGGAGCAAETASRLPAGVNPYGITPTLTINYTSKMINPGLVYGLLKYFPDYATRSM